MRFLSLLIFMMFCCPSYAQYGHIGAGIQGCFPYKKSGEYITFISTIWPKCPAAKAGLQPGDIMVKINGKPVKRDGSDVLDKALEGKPGSMVTLEIKRFGAIKKFTLKRAGITDFNVKLARASFPAFDSIRRIDIAPYKKYNGTCLVGDCENGKGISMENNRMLYADFSNPGKRTTMQIRADDRYEETEYIDNIRDGKRYILFDDGTTYLILYNEGKEHGLATQTDPDGTIYETVYENGVKKSTRTITKSEPPKNR